jgi:iron complex outermembrane recepter protein
MMLQNQLSDWQKTLDNLSAFSRLLFSSAVILLTDCLIILRSRFLFPEVTMAKISKSIYFCTLIPACTVILAAEEAENAIPLEEIQVIGITPNSALGTQINRIPFSVKRGTSDDLENSQSLDISDFMNTAMSSVSINSAQNNPLQPDVQFRGFTASPLLGLAQGLAVYQDGVRLNEPLGDTVNWDMLPESAVSSMDLLSGANPVFGLNALGGALSVTMKNGFNFEETQVEVYTGSWNRTAAYFESGGVFSNSSAGEWGYYLNVSQFNEDGWRALSSSEATNLYSSLSWRNGIASALDIIYQHGESELIGNGSLPVGLAAIQRDAIFTAPDITENDLNQFNIKGSHYFVDGIQFSGNAYWRENTTHSFNGDGSDFVLCDYNGGEQSLLDEADDIEDDLDQLLGIELDAICAGEDDSINSFDDLEALIAQQATIAGLDPEAFELEDVIDDLSGSGVLADEAINNISDRNQESTGFNGQIELTEDFFAFDNRLVIGISYFEGKSKFDSILELSALDPVTRSTLGLGTSTFFDEAATQINTNNETKSWFFNNTWQLTEQLSLIVSGRYNDTDVSLRDRSGMRPELNGDHNFTRFNPAVGFTFDVSDTVNVYGSYSESNRVPTPIELACNEGIFTLAQQFAEETGEDPDDIDFECRLPNAFLADPPLDQVVTTNSELGIRGQWNSLDFELNVFNAKNEDDIIFQTTGRSTGLFANVNETRRRGVEAALNDSNGNLEWQLSLTHINATFEDNFMVLSPNHPYADEEGELAVQHGDRLPGLPETIFKMNAMYHFSEQLSVGADLIYNSDQIMRGDEANELDKVDGYALVNLRATYKAGSNLLIFARVTNLFDTEYENFGLLGEDPRETLPLLVDNRPLFLGVGAPRGAWLGLRYRF